MKRTLFLNGLMGLILIAFAIFPVTGWGQETSFSPMISFWSSLDSFPDTDQTKIMCSRLENGRLMTVEDYWEDTSAFIRTYDGNTWSGDIVVQFDTKAPRVNRNKNNERPIKDVITFLGQVYICGNFFSVDSVPGTAGIAKWNGSRWESLRGGVDTVQNPNRYTIHSLCVFDNRLYAIGDFRGIGNSDANYIAAWDGTEWQPVGGGQPIVNAPPFQHLVTDGQSLYVSGTFNTVGIPSVGVSNVARWDGTHWNFAGNLMPVTFMKYETGLGKIVAFTAENEPIRSWDGSSWTDECPAIGAGVAGHYISDMQFFGGRFYVIANNTNSYTSKLLFYDTPSSAWTEGGHQIIGRYIKSFFNFNSKLYLYGDFENATHETVRPRHIAEINDYVCKIRVHNLYDRNRDCQYQAGVDSNYTFHYYFEQNEYQSRHSCNAPHYSFFYSNQNQEVFDFPGGKYHLKRYQRGMLCRDSLSCGSNLDTFNVDANRNHLNFDAPLTALQPRNFYRDYRITNSRFHFAHVGQDSVQFTVRNVSSHMDTLTYIVGTYDDPFSILEQRVQPEIFTIRRTTDTGNFLNRNEIDTIVVKYNLDHEPPVDSFLTCYTLAFAIEPASTYDCYSESRCDPSYYSPLDNFTKKLFYSRDLYYF